MTRLAANLSMLFGEHTFFDRFAAAAQAGFEGVEFLFPYFFDPERIAEQLERHRLQLVLHNLPAGDFEAGERGIACHPDRVGEFRDGVGEAIRYAKALGVGQLNCLAGIPPPGADADTVRKTLVDNLRFAADALQEHGIRLLIEPINTFDIPGFYLSGTRQAVLLIEETGSSNIHLQYDIYHMQRMEGELAATLEQHIGLIKHIQLADNPGRGEPGTGEVNYRFLLQHLDRIGYEGWIGCEYRPRAGTLEGLGWRERHGL